MGLGCRKKGEIWCGIYALAARGQVLGLLTVCSDLLLVFFKRCQNQFLGCSDARPLADTFKTSSFILKGVVNVSEGLKIKVIVSLILEMRTQVYAPPPPRHFCKIRQPQAANLSIIFGLFSDYKEPISRGFFAPGSVC